MRRFLVIAAFSALPLLTACTKNVTVIDATKTVEGDFTVASNDVIQLKDGAALKVTGDLIVDGAIECEGGAVMVSAKNATINNDVTCMGRATEEGTSQNGITMVVTGTLDIADDATIQSDGNVQIVDDPKKLIADAAGVEHLFNDIIQPSGTGPRIGPMMPDDGEASAIRALAKNNGIDLLAPFIENVAAQAPAPCVDAAGNVVPDCVRISGTWIVGHEQPPEDLDVPTPGKGVKKIIVNFNFGPGRQVVLQDFHMGGPDARSGDDDLDNSCNAHGKDGEDAFRMNVHAGKIRINNFDLTLGSGGDGGSARTKKDCDPGVAKGGKGGNAGNFKMVADEEFIIEGAFTIHPGTGGHGGSAIAMGKDGEPGCPGKKGGDATATGGAGGDNKKKLSVEGTVAGTDNISIDDIFGGEGGPAFAFPGNGGSGQGCGCDGGPGGKGTATAGKGGDASISGAMFGGDAFGGEGGDAEANGGKGGNGGMCDETGPGGNGAKGGDAVGKEGKGGNATTPGPDGTKTETAGDGGNGGDGCNEGKQGPGGSPNGKPGAPGKNLCVEPPKSSSSIPSTDPRSAMRSSTPTTVTPQSSAKATSSSTRSSVQSSTPTTTTGPQIRTVIPANGAKDVPIDTVVQIIFSQPMLRSSVQSAIQASFEYQFQWVNDTTVHLLPIELQKDKDYDFRVASTATDMSGKPLAQSLIVKFHTSKDGPREIEEETGTTGTSLQKVRVAVIQNKYVPLTDLKVESHAECPDHYHAANGVYAISLDHVTLGDPGGCQGYGTVPNVRVMTCLSDGSNCD